MWALLMKKEEKRDTKQTKQKQVGDADVEKTESAVDAIPIIRPIANLIKTEVCTSQEIFDNMSAPLAYLQLGAAAALSCNVHGDGPAENPILLSIQSPCPICCTTPCELVSSVTGNGRPNGLGYLAPLAAILTAVGDHLSNPFSASNVCKINPWTRNNHAVGEHQCSHPFSCSPDMNHCSPSDHVQG